MNYEYCEATGEKCQGCRHESDEFKNIAFWRNESSYKHDDVFCLNCVLNKNIGAPHIEELLYEGKDVEVYTEKNLVSIFVKNNIGCSTHNFSVDRKIEKWSDPGGVNGAGTPRIPREYEVTRLKSTTADVEIHAPKEKHGVKSDYWGNYVKKYIDK